MKNIKIVALVLTLIIVLLGSKDINAQIFDRLDASPHDIAYFKTNKSTPQVKVVYGRPMAKDKQVFGTQVPFGKVWGTGSNEATEIKFYQDTMFGNKFVKAGTYVLYTIPKENYWTVILNTGTDSYGAHFYNPENNIAQIEVPATKGEMIQNFSIAFSIKNYGSQMVLAWAKTRVKVPLYTEQSLITRI
jgi:hypothetical protein